MFESANLDHKLDKAVYRREEAKLRETLLNAQYDLKENGRFPVLILIAGVEGAGKGETINLLNEWMDPRHIYTYAFFEPSDEERERPAQWRFWRSLPPKGKVGVFFGAWHTMPIIQRVTGEIDEAEFAHAISEVVRLEKMLCDEGVLLLKYWFHLSKPQQRKRLRQLEKWQGRLNVLSRDPRFKQISVVGVFEGNDAAGKGGALRRITSALDARCYTNVPVAAPTEEERAQPYLWRFWRHIPRHGRFTFFDRSWYGRVLVERVEGFCSEADWMRAYSEINDFEGAMLRHGVVVVKFWLAISKDEQFRRFKAREKVAFKRFKITAEDWRNRKKWDAYEIAVCDMVDRTSTALAPWTLVEANNKYHARIKVLKTVTHAVEAALEKVGGRAKGKKAKRAAKAAK